jgi:hypothetical protein
MTSGVFVDSVVLESLRLIGWFWVCGMTSGVFVDLVVLESLRLFGWFSVYGMSSGVFVASVVLGGDTIPNGPPCHKFSKHINISKI